MSSIAFIQNINGPEILLIFLIVLLLFGAKRLPDLFRSFGKSLREFKKATSEIEDDIRTAMDEEPEKKAATPSTAETKQVSSESSDQSGKPGADEKSAERA